MKNVPWAPVPDEVREGHVPLLERVDVNLPEVGVGVVAVSQPGVWARGRRLGRVDGGDVGGDPTRGPVTRLTLQVKSL